MPSNPVGKARHFLFLAALALKAGAPLDFINFLIYRTPWGLAWARLLGHRFHRSTFVWFRKGDANTRVTLLLPRLKMQYPALRSIELELDLYSRDGRPVKKWRIPELSLEKPFVLDAGRLPVEFRVDGPFEGSLLIRQRLHLPDKDVLRGKALFSSMHTYIDYYSEGAFVTTLHDYSAFLPDQGISYAKLGMIPAYCDSRRETFLIFHAANAGIGGRDLEVRLYNAAGACLQTRLAAMKPFSVRKTTLSEFFPDAPSFLGGEAGQVVVQGLFRAVLRRIAYGIEDKASKTFSLDHCYYHGVEKPTFISAEQRERVPKGWSNPFFVIEDEHLSTSALLFQSAEDPVEKHVDVLVYDAQGKCVARVSPFARLKGNAVKRISIRDLLGPGFSLPFMGHAEVLYHKEPNARRYPKELDLYVEYNSGGRLATVIFGADAWNSSKAIQNKSYRSCCRIVCDARHTTYVAISNCSHDYNYSLNVFFTLSLCIEEGQVLESKKMNIAPNATLFLPVEELFPRAAELLGDNQGVGILTTTDINCACLTHVFLTQDRVSKALSVEHSLDV